NHTSTHSPSSSSLSFLSSSPLFSSSVGNTSQAIASNETSKLEAQPSSQSIARAALDGFIDVNNAQLGSSEMISTSETQWQPTMFGQPLPEPLPPAVQQQNISERPGTSAAMPPTNIPLSMT